MSSAPPAPASKARVVVLDDDPDLVESLRELVRIGSHAECLTATTYDDLVALGERALACDVAVLDINLGEGAPSGLAAYRWLRNHDFRGRVVFLTGHAENHPLVQAAREFGHIRILEKPAPAEALLQLLPPT